MKLYFQNKFDEEIIIAYPNNIDEAFLKIKKFLNEHHFKSYYTRIWKENNRLIFDVGSHSEFFFLEE